MSKDLVPRVSSSVGKGHNPAKCEHQRYPGSSSPSPKIPRKGFSLKDVLSSPWALEFLVPTNPQTDGCKLDSGLVDLGPHPK